MSPQHEDESCEGYEKRREEEDREKLRQCEQADAILAAREEHSDE